MFRTYRIYPSLILAIAILLPYSAQAAENQNFRVAGDKSVTIGEYQFSDMQAYTESEQFRARGGRCAADLIASRMPGDAREAKSPSDCSLTLTRIKQEYQPTVTFKIPVWFHVIKRTDGFGEVSNAAINAQIQVLNEDFQAIAGTMGQAGVDAKIEFELAGITRTTNNAWYADSREVELVYKAALRKDPSKFLNIYTNDARGFLGYAYFPVGSAGQYFDGVVMLSQSVGGRNNGFGGYDQGRTMVHEIGHYLGLYHTFDGNSCQNTFALGDLIVDTNAELAPFFGDPNSCPTGPSSCGTPDPVDNYMDYNYDSCMNKFTAQQVNRMICSMVNYRPGFASVEDAKGNIVPILNLLMDDED